MAGNVDVLRRLVEAAHQDDLEAAQACLDPEVEWIPARAATEGAYIGYAGFARFVTDTRESFEEFVPHFEYRDLGDRVVAWGTITVRGRESGMSMDVPVGGIFDLRDGLVTRWRDLGSKAAAFAAAGLED